MHLHILGIGGTFMAGVAALARELGHRVSGSDANLYPPMSTQLADLDVQLMEGFSADHLDEPPDLIIVGNALSRGVPIVEAMLDRNLAYTSGPAWLATNVLAGQWTLAVAGTHGKTTTASMLAWLLERAGLEPGFLIGGVPGNFNVSARIGGGRYFVIEADEYDTAFFDKRSKFIHYRPRTLILNNLEFDHADIFDSIDDIKRQFHHLVRTVPNNGRIVVNQQDKNLADVLAMGAWTPVEHFLAHETDDAESDAPWRALARKADATEFDLLTPDARVPVSWSVVGLHNMSNGLAAVAAARQVGVEPETCAKALADFRSGRRRLELLGKFNDICVYDDFAHHPTAIRKTLQALRAKVGPARIHAVLEPRSNTMKRGVHRETLAPALAEADKTWLLRPDGLDWDLEAVARNCPGVGQVFDSVDTLLEALVNAAHSGDQIIIMSNGGFEGLPHRLTRRLAGSTTK